MLSAKAHFVFWALSFISVLAQPLRPWLQKLFEADDEVQGIFKHAVVYYGVWLCFYIVELRTRPPLHGMPPRHDRRPPGLGWYPWVVGGWALRNRDWLFELGTALMCLIVGDAALWASGVEEEEEWVRGKIVRVLGTYMYLGTVDPVWRNQLGHDMMLFSNAVLELVFRNALVSTASIGALAITVETAAFVYTGEPFDVFEFWFGGATRPHQILVLVLLLAPFTDLADTVIYMVLRRHDYQEYVEQMNELIRLRSFSVVVERFWVMFWLSVMYYVLVVFSVMSLLWEMAGDGIWGNFSSWIGVW
ncbi:uncharacterized protein Triagg1_341 [Trichoderma aggressivum f. europaeum]|uniref:Uncharacterized protein n=1 Tax=Trichoderma aggressivum f. europaeum TaxID=173218 RepID=A0AAE1IL85_9HYPO|nr:hypothetical protein Triagg1_341 [Trichoderma aggressivum f. europaeum]